MPLTQQQIDTLEDSIIGYAFPAIYFDFVKNTQINAGNMRALENAIFKMLISPHQQKTLHGLANIIYWGNANAGYQQYRVNRFLNGVTTHQIKQFQGMIVNGNIPTLRQIKNLRMPQYSGISFISKIVAFLNPAQFCVLDLLLARLGNVPGTKAIHSLSFTTQVGITANNSASYCQWCSECQAISNQYYNGQYRVVDVERGFFNLIQNGHLAAAQVIYNAA